MNKTALITGVTGQDGYLLAKYLLDLGYTVYGTGRRKDDKGWRFKEKELNNSNFHYIQLDITSQKNCYNVIKEIRPDEIYNLAAQSFVPTSWNQPELTIKTNSVGILNILEATLSLSLHDTRIYQASSSEMFGNAETEKQNENTPMRPVSIYGASKLLAHNIVSHYREFYNLYVVSGILFNHESEWRSDFFVTRKISKGVAAIKLGLADKIKLGNLNAKRDWGYAGDYVKVMHKMLQQKFPKDYCIGTGQTRSVSDFAAKAFEAAGILNWKSYIEIDKRFVRKNELYILCADATAAEHDLEWIPETTFDMLVEKMVNADIERLSKITIK